MDDAKLRALVESEPFTSAITPAVLIDTERVRHNIATTLGYLGTPRWRPHAKTARLPWTINELRGAGITRFKASTTTEVALLLRSGVRDVLLAYPAIGPTQWRLAELAREFPEAQVSALVDNVAALSGWRPGPVAAFLDVDTGGGRTGIQAQDAPSTLAILTELRARGVAFGGLHSYDGHLADLAEADQQLAVAAELRDLVALAERIEATGTEVREIVAGGSHTFIPGARTQLPGPWRARLSFGPGTVVYNDLRSLDRFGPKGFQCAAFALSRVVSDQGAGRITVDAGLTTIQVDGGRPHAQVLGLPAQVGAPAQEHLKVTIGSGPVPAVGTPLLLVPRHIDTMLAQFDRVYLCETGSVWESTTVQRPF